MLLIINKRQQGSSNSITKAHLKCISKSRSMHLTKHSRDLKADYLSGFSKEKLLLLTPHCSCPCRTRADLSGLCIAHTQKCAISSQLAFKSPLSIAETLSESFFRNNATFLFIICVRSCVQCLWIPYSHTL